MEKLVLADVMPNAITRNIHIANVSVVEPIMVQADSKRFKIPGNYKSNGLKNILERKDSMKKNVLYSMEIIANRIYLNKYKNHDSRLQFRS